MNPYDAKSDIPHKGKTWNLIPDLTCSIDAFKSKSAARPYAFMSLCNIKRCSLQLTFLLMHAYAVWLCQCAFNHLRRQWQTAVMASRVDASSSGTMGRVLRFLSNLGSHHRAISPVLITFYRPLHLAELPFLGSHRQLCVWLAALRFLPQRLCIVR